MKNSKTLSIITIILASLTAVSSTVFAWVASNRNLDSNGMQMGVDTTSNLVISDSASEIVRPDYMNVSLLFATNTEKVSPCTHDDGYATKLKYVTNTMQIDFITGNKRGSATEELAYANAENVLDGVQYYVERTVYIAANGRAFDSATLTGRITSAMVEAVEVTSWSTFYAASVDFYVMDGATPVYKGTSNVATKGAIDLVSNGTIPLNTEGYLTIMMRFYMDGALQDGKGKAYVNTATVDTRTVALDVSFEVAE